MQELNRIEPEQQPDGAISLIMSIDPQRMQNEMKSISRFQSLVNENLKPDHDYGVIPGTQKPTLLKPGAEKILMLMGLQSQYEVVDKVENWGEGFFAYTIRATLVHDGQVITQGIGAANTKETRYQQKHWDASQGRKVWDGETYQDPYTLQNTVLKMAKKRAQVDATLTVASLSDVFTQDVEDMNIAPDATPEPVSRKDATSTVVGFGKYKGRTLGDIVEDDRSYVEWIAKSAKQPEMKVAAKKVLDQQDEPIQLQPEPQQSRPSPSRPEPRNTPPEDHAGADAGMESLLASEPY